MENNELNTLDSELLSRETAKRRRDLLPWWIKVFLWIFLVFGIIAPAGVVLGLMDLSFQLSIYGLTTSDPLSIPGLFLTAVFILKGVLALGLWSEKDWAIKLGMVDAILGIAVCVFTMVIYPLLYNESGFHVTFRIELAVLILFLITLNKIKNDWEKIAIE
jgi:hypothetical protein